MSVVRAMALSLIVAAPLAAQTPAAAPVTIPGVKAVQVCVDCGDPPPRFPVAIAKEETRTVMARRAPAPLAVLVNNRQDPTLIEHFTLAWQGVEKGPADLVLTVSSALQRPGTYDVVIDLLPESEKRDALVTLNVTIPAAEIETPAKLRIDRTVLAPELIGGGETKLPLWIREKGRLRAIKGLTGQTGSLDMGAEQIEGHVDVAAVDIPADGKPHTVTYTLSGGFPLGTATGQLRLVATGLKDAVNVPVEVRSRLHVWLLFAAIAAGLFLSYLTKVYLAGRIAQAQAKALAAKLLADVRADRAKYAEQQFKDAVDVPVTALETAIDKNPTADIEEKRKALDTKWREAVTAADARRAEFKTNASRFADLVALEWKVPPSLRKPLDDARAASRTVLASQNADIEARKQALADAQKPLMSALVERGSEWQRGVTELLASVVARRHGLPDDLLTTLAGALTAWERTYPTVSEVPAAVTIDRIEAALRTLTGHYLAAGDATQLMASRLTRTIDEVASELGASDLSAVSTAADALRLAVRAANDDPITANIGVVSQRQDALQEAWSRTILEALEAQDLAVKKAARDDIAKQRFRSAAARKTQGAVLLGPSAQVAIAGVVAERLPLPTVPGLPPSSVIDFLSRAAGSPYLSLFLDSAAELRRAKRWQTLIVGLLFMAWAFGSFGSTWDGTWTGLWKVFVAAFSVDVAADTLLGKVKSA